MGNLLFGPLERHRAKERARAEARFAAVVAMEERLERYLAVRGGAVRPGPSERVRDTGSGKVTQTGRH